MSKIVLSKYRHYLSENGHYPTFFQEIFRMQVKLISRILIRPEFLDLQFQNFLFGILKISKLLLKKSIFDFLF